MALDLSALTAAAQANSDTIAAGVDVIRALMAEVAANINDPVALQAQVDKVNAATLALSTAISATPPDPAARRSRP